MSRSASIAMAVGLLVGLLGTSTATAGKITIDFDLSGSTLQILGGIINVPPDGSITAASSSISVRGNSATDATPGPATLNTLAAAATINANPGGATTVTGTLNATKTAGGSGVLSAGLSQIVFGGPTVISIGGIINCTGVGCSFLQLPTTLSGPNAFAAIPMTIGNINVSGAATLAGSLSFSVSGFSMLLQLVGSEVSRVFVPEPGSFGMVGLGLLTLATGGWVRIRRR